MSRKNNNNNVDSQKNILLGRWEKITNAKCSEIYPDKLEFMDKGIYAGRKAEGALIISYWDAGTYQILIEDQVRISTANDEEVNYKFSISADNILSFVDRNGCEFRYRRL